MLYEQSDEQIYTRQLEAGHIKHPVKLFLKNKAISLVERLNSDPLDNWSYKAINHPGEYAHVNIYDEHGEYVGSL